MNYRLIDPEKNSNRDYSIPEEQYNKLQPSEQDLYEKDDDEDWDPDEDLDDDEDED